MSEPDSTSRAVALGDFVLDLSRRTLRRGANNVHLTSKPFDVLALLVENRGRVVTKQELMDAVWKDTCVVEDNLTQAILRIRRVLGDEKDAPQFVQTVPRVGYRFVGPVRPLEPIARDADSTPPLTTRRRRPLTWWMAAGVLLLALVEGAWWLAGPFDGRPAGGPEALLPVPRQVPLSTPSATKPVFEADGVHFLYVGYRQGQPGIGDIYRGSLDTPDVLRVTRDLDPRGDHPVLTPDGLGVVFSRWRSGDDGTRWPDLWTVAITGGDARVLVEQASGAGFSPDGTWMAFTKHLPQSKPLWVAPRADLTRQRQVAPRGFTPRWSPDGRWMAFTTSDPEGGAGHLWIASGDLVVRRQLTRGLQQFYGMAWLPGSRHVVYGASGDGGFRVWKASIDGGEAVAMTAGVGSSSSPAIAPEGRTLLFSHVVPSRNLVHAPGVEGSSGAEITEDQYHVWPVLSPDGGRVVSVIQTPGFDERLYVTDLTTRASVRASDRPAGHPVWLDRDHVAYLCAATPDGTEIRVADLTTGVNETWLRLAGRASWLAVSADRQRIAAVILGPNGRQSVTVRDLRARRDFVIAEGGEYEHLRWVPGRARLSWSGPAKSVGRESDGIWIRDLEDSPVVRLVPDGHSPVWAEDGASVYYSRIGDNGGLWRFTLGKQAPVRLQRWTEVDDFDVRNGNLVFARIRSNTKIFRLPLS